MLRPGPIRMSLMNTPSAPEGARARLRNPSHTIHAHLPFRCTDSHTSPLRRGGNSSSETSAGSWFLSTSKSWTSSLVLRSMRSAARLDAITSVLPKAWRAQEVRACERRSVRGARAFPTSLIGAMLARPCAARGYIHKQSPHEVAPRRPLAATARASDGSRTHRRHPGSAANLGQRWNSRKDLSCAMIDVW